MKIKDGPVTVNEVRMMLKLLEANRSGDSITVLECSVALVKGRLEDDIDMYSMEAESFYALANEVSSKLTPSGNNLDAFIRAFGS